MYSKWLEVWGILKGDTRSISTVDLIPISARTIPPVIKTLSLISKGWFKRLLIKFDWKIEVGLFIGKMGVDGK